MIRFKEECPPHKIDCPLKENRDEAHERKKNRYGTLCANCMEKGWICHVIPIEVGSRGFLGHSVISFLSKKKGITGRSLKVVSNRLQTTAQYTSSWIWSNREVFSMNEMYVEPPFLCDYVTSRNGYCKRVITLTTESKCVF